MELFALNLNIHCILVRSIDMKSIIDSRRIFTMSLLFKCCLTFLFRCKGKSFSIYSFQICALFIY
jgi:hypothetical protein